MNYYNENDPKAAAWLRELIKAGHISEGVVDERSIVDVQPRELDGYRQCHFFAGIGGWSYALRLAGVPDHEPVWTGSCPCQPFSSATRGRGKGKQCVKHLWPIWRKLIAAKTPRTLFGEQVAQDDTWHSEVGNDLESLNYAFGSAVFPAFAVGKDHARQRLYFVGHSNSNSKPRFSIHAETQRVSWCNCESSRMVPENGIPDSVALLRGFGNAIVPEQAAEFISAFYEALHDG